MLVKNTGEEPIDAVRVETRTEFVGVDTRRKGVGEGVRGRGVLAAGPRRDRGYSARSESPPRRRQDPMIRSLYAQITRRRAPMSPRRTTLGGSTSAATGGSVGGTAFDNADAGRADRDPLRLGAGRLPGRRVQEVLGNGTTGGGGDHARQVTRLMASQYRLGIRLLECRSRLGSSVRPRPC